jgi:hypothetical protein
MEATSRTPPPDPSGIRIGDVGGSVNFSALGDIVGGDKITTITTTIQISVEAITQRPLITASPYRGLDRFEDRDKDLFFGRDQLIKSLLAQLSASNVLLVLGASGSGKSSVVRAGLLPQLSQLIGARFRYFTFVPDVNPFESLRTAVQGAGFSQAQTRELAEAKPETPAKLIHTLQRSGDQWLFFVDQFEEIFTVGDEKLRAAFIAALVQIAQDPNSSTKLVLAMRADFLDRFSPFPQFAKIIEKNIDFVADMHADELRQAIEQPAARHGVVFEQGLVEEIIKDVQGQAGSLPLLQYTLDLLWQEEAREDGLADRHLNTKAYRELGGVRGALQKRADEIYDSFADGADGKTASPKQEIVRQIFLRLVDLAGEGSNDAAWRPVRRRASIAMFATAQEQEILQALINQKLLVSNREGDDATVEVAHEALFTSWGRLKNWIDAGKQVIFARNRLADDARRWQRRQHEDDAGADEELLSGSRLAQALEMRARGDFDTLFGGLPEMETQFLDASNALRDRRRQEEQERLQRDLAQAQALATEQKKRADDQAKAATRQRRLTWVMIALSLIAVGVAVFAWNAKRQATEAAQAVTQRSSLAQYESALRAIADSDEGEGFARLAAALQIWPGNQLAADRLFGLLTQRNFAFPLPGRTDTSTAQVETVSPVSGPVRLLVHQEGLTEIAKEFSASGAEDDPGRGIDISLGEHAQFSPDGRLAADVSGGSPTDVTVFDLDVPGTAKWKTPIQNKVAGLAFFPDQGTVIIGLAAQEGGKSDGLHFAFWHYRPQGGAAGPISPPLPEFRLSLGDAVDLAHSSLEYLTPLPETTEMLVQFATAVGEVSTHWLVHVKVDFTTNLLQPITAPAETKWTSRPIVSMNGQSVACFSENGGHHQIQVVERKSLGALKEIEPWEIPAGEWGDNVKKRIQFWPGTNQLVLFCGGRALWTPVSGWARWNKMALGPVWFVDDYAAIDTNQTIVTWKSISSKTHASANAHFAFRLFDGRPGFAWPDIVLGKRLPPTPPAILAPLANDERVICVSSHGTKLVAKPVDTGLESFIPNFEMVGNTGRRDPISPTGTDPVSDMNSVVGSFSKDGAILAVVVDGKLIVLDTATHQPMSNVSELRVRLHGEIYETIGDSRAIAFTEHPDVVCVASNQGGVLLWDWRRGQPFSDVLRPNSAQLDNDSKFTLEAGPGTIALTIETGDRIERRLYQTSFGPYPDGLPKQIIELSRLLGGQFMDENSVIHNVFEPGEKSAAMRMRELRDEFRRGNPNDKLMQFGTWFFGDRAMRTASATGKSTVPDMFEMLLKIGAFDDAELLTFGDVAKLKRVDVARIEASAERARKDEQKSPEGKEK